MLWPPARTGRPRGRTHSGREAAGMSEAEELIGAGDAAVPARSPAGGDAAGALAGKTVVVTGASRGIGLEVARTMAAGGAWVGMVARGRDALAAAAAEV